MRFLSLFISVLALSHSAAASSSSVHYDTRLSTVNRAGGWGHMDASLEAGRYEPHHAHTWVTMAEGTPHFAYDPFNLEAGPSVWATVTPDWATCGGNKQSPVALPAYITANIDTTGLLHPLSPAYGGAIPAVNLTLFNTGHALQVNLPTGLSLTGGALGSSSYSALQLHMHGRSEHSIAGAQYPLEIHIVHSDLTRDANDTRQLTVIGIMVSESSSDNLALKPLSDLVLSATFNSSLNYKDGNATFNSPFNLTSLLPTNLDYYHYNGSLTTPPCSEKVVWHVLATPITASRAQILALTAPFGAVGNSRPTQSLNGRSIVATSFQAPTPAPTAAPTTATPTTPTPTTPAPTTPTPTVAPTPLNQTCKNTAITITGSLASVVSVLAMIWNIMQ